MILRGEYEVLFDVTCDSFNQSNVDFTIKITMQLNNRIYCTLTFGYVLWEILYCNTIIVINS